MAELGVTQLGRGPAVVLVHGSVAGGAQTWSAQAPLARRYTLLVIDRPGFHGEPLERRVDFEHDAPLVAEVLGDGAHLVGHSYGGVIALLAAALRPEAVRSLTVIEPPAFSVAPEDPAVQAFVSQAGALFREGPEDPEELLRRFLELVSPGGRPPESPLRPGVRTGVELLRTERLPWEADIPLDTLAAAGLRTLVVSGGHHQAFEAVCDVLERRLAAERAVLRGAGHGVQRLGGPFNDRLTAFLAAA